MATLWRTDEDPAAFRERAAGSLPGLLGIEIAEIGGDFLRATMPIDARHIQPAGILHGGASVVLAETIGSLCANLAAGPGERRVGVEVNANHLAPVLPGDTVTAECRPLRIGRAIQVWSIELRRGDGTLTCVARLTTAAAPAKPPAPAPGSPA